MTVEEAREIDMREEHRSFVITKSPLSPFTAPKNRPDKLVALSVLRRSFGEKGSL